MADRVRAVIVDDEPLARLYLRQLLSRDPEVEVVGESGNGDEAVSLLSRRTCDLLFLDVEMPTTDGFGLLEALGDPLPAIVFVTAHDRYAIRAFEVQALDYVLKPFDEERFDRTLHRAKQRLRKERADNALSEVRGLLQEIRARNEHLDRVLVRNGDRSFFVAAADIDWVEAQGNYVLIHAGDSSHLVRESISTIETRLDGHRFRRIHRSAIVNLDRVKELQAWFHGEHRLFLRDGTELRVSRSYRKNLGDVAEG